MEERLNARQNQIYMKLSQFNEVKINELSQVLDVSEMTIRRDLQRMEELGLLKRTFGGAIKVASEDVRLSEREQRMTDEKKKIGELAAMFISDGEVVFLDAGTTTFQIARHLQLGSDVTVVTNAIHVAVELLGKNIQTIVVGGTLLDTTASLIGPIAEDALSNMAFDSVFLGATGLDIEHGFSNSNMFESEVKRTVIRNARSVNIVLDHTKLGVRALASFARLDEVDRIITDREPDTEILKTCKDVGVQVVFI
ncbi:DeoR/GlpR family DNA-binding transcription regulator [Alicyclobacillus dauci]|uniref:DeoR/GlpR family DNA-binding transcription regulator n=1 Tax=Alicyclobacillus dauci TaxID=1475485 RepID=A0ABY6Z5S8_9BACL|nr:DeoR/GlpR family DNA-binding transcription regulator [Alicyclobacillus dauci]WAH37972.1 DeoR/GlpR family DNA-binding transcription regulator [Alicyclobacillus dauci]